MIYQLNPTDYFCQYIPPLSPLYQNLSMENMHDCSPALQMEYVGMIHLYKNLKSLPDKWIGLTSYRQMMKTQYVETDKAKIERLLEDNDVLTWFWLDRLKPMAEADEQNHPGILSRMQDAMRACNRKIPSIYFTQSFGVYANYWIMSKRNFAGYMEWSLPIADWLMKQDDSLLALDVGHFNYVGLIMERMFIFWYITRRKLIYDLVQNKLVAPESKIVTVP